jgi:hypothetical protein
MSVDDILKHADDIMKQEDEDSMKDLDAIDAEESSLNSGNKKKVRKIEGQKNPEIDYSTTNGGSSIKNFWWFLKYPIPTETYANMAEEKQICIKCSQSITLIAKHLMDIANFHAQDRETEMREVLITEKTKLKTKEQLEREKRTKKKNQKIGQDTNEYYHMLQQMADNGNGDAALEMAQEYYFGNAEQGVPENPNLAMDYYARAARNDREGFAMANHGIMMLNGKKFE